MYVIKQEIKKEENKEKELFDVTQKIDFKKLNIKFDETTIQESSVESKED